MIGPNSPRRRQIVDAAREIAAAQGWSAVTVRAIGARIGCSAPAIYQYFRDKDAVVAAVAEEGQTQLSAAIETAAKATGGAGKRVRAAMRGFWDFAMAHPELYAAIYGGEGMRGRGARPAPEALQRLVAKLGQKRGAAEAAADIADRFAALIYGFAPFAAAPEFPGGRARAWALCERAIEDAIRRLGRD